VHPCGIPLTCTVPGDCCDALPCHDCEASRHHILDNDEPDQRQLEQNLASTCSATQKERNSRVLRRGVPLDSGFGFLIQVGVVLRVLQLAVEEAVTMCCSGTLYAASLTCRTKPYWGR
jgi:hypothetical protein